MKIKVVYKTHDDGSYEASSVVFPTCVGFGKNRNEALHKLDEAIMDMLKMKRRK